jgi:hypothetical protein
MRQTMTFTSRNLNAWHIPGEIHVWYGNHFLRIQLRRNIDAERHDLLHIKMFTTLELFPGTTMLLLP